MIVAQLVESLGIGGAENLAVQIANAVAERGHTSLVYVLDRTGLLEEKIAPAVTCHHFNYRRRSILNPLAFTVSVARGYRMLRSRLRADGVQILQCHLPTPNMWGLTLAATRVCHVIATIHNNKEFSYGSDESRRGRLRHAAYRQVVRRCDAVVAVSEQVRRSFLEELGLSEREAPRLVSVPNGVALPDPDPDRRRAVRRELGVADDQLLLLGIGRLCEQKNFEDLVAAVAALGDQRHRFRVAIAGDGPRREALARLVAEKGLDGTVTLLGAVSDVASLIQAADLLVMPSLWEGLPLALLEGMAGGLPVVGYRIAGLADVVQDGEQGLLVPVRDVAGLAAACRRLAGDPALRQRLGRAARGLVERSYSFDRLMERLGALYEAVASGAAPPFSLP